MKHTSMGQFFRPMEFSFMQRVASNTRPPQTEKKRQVRAIDNSVASQVRTGLTPDGKQRCKILAIDRAIPVQVTLALGAQPI